MRAGFIPNFDNEITQIEQIGSVGFFFGFGLKFGYPELIINRYPESWSRRYESEAYYVKDPMALWTLTRRGMMRWSKCKMPDAFGVLKEAKKHGLAYGATFVFAGKRKRSFLSVARSDRELTDDEMSRLMMKVDLWGGLFEKEGLKLSEKEIEALALMRDGYTQDEAADLVGITKAAFKLRLSSCQKKLGARNTTQAVGMALRGGLI